MLTPAVRYRIRKILDAGLDLYTRNRASLGHFSQTGAATCWMLAAATIFPGRRTKAALGLWL
jgi:hypothetical protein